MIPHRKVNKFVSRGPHVVGPDIVWLHQSGPDVLLDVVLVAGADRTRVVGIEEKRLKIAVAAPAGAAANDALVRFVTRTLGVVRAQVSIVGGVPASRRKTLRLASVLYARAKLRLHPSRAGQE